LLVIGLGLRKQTSQLDLVLVQISFVKPLASLDLCETFLNLRF
jgi:hypothetical protein